MISFEKIGSDNIWKIIKLSVNPEQGNFVASNTESILEAYAAISDGHIALPFAVCDNNIPVGFIMFGYGTTEDEDEPEIAAGNYCIWRLMIDKAYQGKGYGKSALAEALKYLRTRPCGPADYCWLSYEPTNIAAKTLYASAGFVENGETDGDEIVAVLKL